MFIRPGNPSTNLMPRASVPHHAGYTDVTGNPERHRPYRGLAFVCPRCKLTVSVEGHTYGSRCGPVRYCECDCGKRVKILLPHGAHQTTADAGRPA